MKTLIYLLGILIFLTACNSNTGSKISSKLKEIVEIPGGINAEIIGFDLEDTTLNADLIAEVTIKEKVEEVEEEPLPYTV